MRDEVSETENIRRNLAIERQIVEGCDILLDVQQIFIRQGTIFSYYTFTVLFVILYLFVFFLQNYIWQHQTCSAAIF